MKVKVSLSNKVKNDAEEPISHGAIPPLHSFDPIWETIHHWHHIITFQSRWHGQKSPFVEWTPSGGKGYPPLGQSKINSLTKYDPKPPSKSWTGCIIL